MSNIATVRGLAALQKKLRTLPVDLQEKHNQAACREGGKVFAAEAEILAPKASGDLSKSISVRKVNTKNRFRKAVSVRPRKGKGVDPFYWHFLEFGTIKMNSQPYLRPAFDNKVNLALRAYRERMRKGLRRVAK